MLVILLPQSPGQSLLSASLLSSILLGAQGSYQNGVTYGVPPSGLGAYGASKDKIRAMKLKEIQILDTCSVSPLVTLLFWRQLALQNSPRVQSLMGPFFLGEVTAFTTANHAWAPDHPLVPLKPAS